MNRRQFFGMSALAVAAAGFPAIVLPERTIFLPPQHGWQPSALGHGYMREVEQYIISTDEMRYRYDVIGRDIWGKEYQFHVETKRPDPEIAALVITNRFRHDGLIAIPPNKARDFKLELPPTIYARYI